MNLSRFIAIVCLQMTPLLAAAEQPNFVIIFTDDQGYQDVGCFGSPDIRTPRLDAMAAGGMKFTSFYAQPICGPSGAALVTGCYPMPVAERGHTKQVHPILHEHEITFAEVLKTRGYRTACFGKWDLAKHAQSGFFMDRRVAKTRGRERCSNQTVRERMGRLRPSSVRVMPYGNQVRLALATSSFLSEGERIV